MAENPPPRRLGVIADTHGRLPREVLTLFAGVELILHAGDIGRAEVIAELATVAPVLAVHGNVDDAALTRLHPSFRVVETFLGRVAMTHGHLAEAPSTDLPRMAAFFAKRSPAIVIYGHSHIARIDRVGDVVLFNPGSAGQPRFGRGASVGIISEELSGEPRIELLSLPSGGVRV